MDKYYIDSIKITLQEEICFYRLQMCSHVVFSFAYHLAGMKSILALLCIPTPCYYRQWRPLGVRVINSADSRCLKMKDMLAASGILNDIIFDHLVLARVSINTFGCVFLIMLLFKVS